MKNPLALLFVTALAATAALAQDQGAPPDSAPAEPQVSANVEDTPPAPEDSADQPAVPVPYPVSRYEAAWTKNPFLRKTVAIVQEKESVLKDWALNGMAEYDGKIRVTMVNKQTGEYKHVTNQDAPDAEFRLIKANFNRNRADASAEIEKGGEKAVIKYDENLTSKPLTINNTQRAAAGTPGAAGQPGGAPGAVRPGTPVSATRGGVQGGVQGASGQPGMAPMAAPGAVNPAGQPVANTPVAPGATLPPTISRRRQLVPVPPPPPAPVIPAQQ